MGDLLDQLIEQCKHGDRKAQEEVYKRYSALLFSICLRYHTTYEDAQDTFQEGFITIFKKIDQFQFKGSFEGWMRRIIVNRCLENIRKKEYFLQPEILESLSDDDETYSFDQINYNQLLDFVQQLSPQYRQVFNLYVFDGYTHQEIAEALAISVGTSKSNLSRARTILKEKINSFTHSNSYE